MKAIKSIHLFFLLTAMSSIGSGEEQAAPQNWYVEVVLKHKVSLRGVVVEERFVEKIVKGTYVVANRADEEAGLRLWFVDQNPGFIFFHYNRIAKVKKIAAIEAPLEGLYERATPAKEEKKEEQVESARPLDNGKEKQEQVENARPLDNGKEKQEVAIDEERLMLLAEAQAMEELDPRHRELLQAFPPDEGWSTEVYEKYKPRIGRNKAKGNAFDDIPKSYVHFDYAYDEWKPAHDALQEKTRQIYKQLEAKELERLEKQAKSEVAVDRITPSQIESLKAKAKERRIDQPATWTKFQEHFAVTSLENLPQNRFNDAVKWLETLAE